MRQFDLISQRRFARLKGVSFGPSPVKGRQWYVSHRTIFAVFRMVIHSLHEGVERLDKVRELENFLLDPLHRTEELLQVAP